MDRTGPGTVLALAAGTGYLLTGTALLLQGLGLLGLRWALLMPVLLIVVGGLTALSGTVEAHRRRDVR